MAKTSAFEQTHSVSDASIRSDEKLHPSPNQPAGHAYTMWSKSIHPTLVPIVYFFTFHSPYPIY